MESIQIFRIIEIEIYVLMAYVPKSFYILSRLRSSSWVEN